MADRQSYTRNYYIDEGGDSTLFSRSGKVLIGSEGCSRFFILGVLDVPDPAALQCSTDSLRDQLLNDPYFSDVPSMQESTRKTALAFHAKDDLPEVRREVFRLLRDTEDLRFFEKLHKSSRFEIFFSKRGRADRTAALREALETTRSRFAEQHDLQSEASLHVTEIAPKEQAGLQAVDYFVWALQRLYERHEDRFVTYLWPAFRVVQDVHDRRKVGYGMYYTQKRPLNAAALAWRQNKKPPRI